MQLENLWLWVRQLQDMLEHMKMQLILRPKYYMLVKKETKWFQKCCMTLQMNKILLDSNERCYQLIRLHWVPLSLWTKYRANKCIDSHMDGLFFLRCNVLHMSVFSLEGTR